MFFFYHKTQNALLNLTRVFPRCSNLTHSCIKGSFLEPECDWSDGDLVFANSTCFAEDTLAAIAERATLLRPGARVVTFTTALKTPWLRVLLKKRYQMSWGPATVFVHQKLRSENKMDLRYCI